MRSSGRKWGSFLLAVMLVLGMFAQGVPANAWQVAAPAESGENGAEPEQPANESLIAPQAATAEDGMTTVEGDFFAITTVINGHTWALGGEEGWGSYVNLYPYDPNDIRQLWYEDENGCLQWFPNTIYLNENGEAHRCGLYLYQGSGGYESNNIRASSNWSWYLNASDSGGLEGFVPVKLDGGYIKIHDYEHLLSAPHLPVNDHVGIAVVTYELKYESSRYEQGYSLDVDVLEIFKTPSRSDELTFQKVFPEEAPRYPHFVDYKLEQDDWKITYNTDGTYNVEVTGRLNFPIREKYDFAAASLWCGDTMYGEVEIAPGEQAFTVRAENLPDEQEAHFWFIIEEFFVGSVDEVPESGWQSCVDLIYKDAVRELHEETVSIPVRKIWDDGEGRHSGDSVDLCLMENGEETSYTVTLNEENGWQGAFKHAPYERWTYSGSCGGGGGRAADGPWSGRPKLPLDPRGIYTIVETGGTPGYIPSYSFEDLTKPAEPMVLTPGEAPSVQVVFTPDDGGDPLAMNCSENYNHKVEKYVQGEESQRLFLNGDDTLVTEGIDTPYRFGWPYHDLLHFEEANEKGKYYLYTVDSRNGKLYFSADKGEIPDSSQATAFEFRDFETGEALKALPENTFQPVEALLQPYVRGQGTDAVICLEQLGYYLYPYEPGFSKMKATICCMDGQLVAINEGGSTWVILEPCGEAPGEYLLRMPVFEDYSTGEWHIGYAALDERVGDLRPAEGKEDALHIALVDSIPQDAGSFKGMFTVTNTLPPASLEVSKTVSGGADQNKAFSFIVTLSGDPISGVYGDMEFENGVAAFTLKHGEKKTAGNLPAGVTYTVLETDNAGYTVTVNGSEAADGKVSGTLTGGETVTLAFNNDKPEPPTEPSEPSKPSDPSEPSSPSEPSKPSEPSDPSEPSKPSEPSDPNKPSEPSKPTSPAKPTEPDAPKTGDETNMGLLFCVMGVSLAGIVLLAFLLLKKNYSGKYLK